MKLNNEENNDDKQNKSDTKEENTPTMILTIDIGNNQLKKLNIYNIYNTEQDIYNFCLKNQLDFTILKEIQKQIEILISNKLKQNSKQNQINNSSLKTKDINNNEKNKLQNSSNISDNLAETNFNTNQPNFIENMNDLEILNNYNTKFICNNGNNSNLKKYYSKVNNNINNNLNNIKDNKKIIRHKIHESKIEELDRESELFNNNLFSPVINSYTPNNSFFYIISSFNSVKNKNKNYPNITLRNYFSKEEDIYYTENNPLFTNNNENNKKMKKNKKINKVVNKSVSLNGIHLKNYNIGKDLYERNLKYNEEKTEKLKVLKQNLESDLDEDNTFAPKINKISKTQKEYRKQKKLEYSNPDIIKNYKKYKEEKIKSLKEKQEKEFEKKYTFKPMINNCSLIFKKNTSQSHNFKKIENILNIKNISRSNTNVNKNFKNNNISKECSKSITRFEKLYNERINQEENQNKLRQKIYNEFSFKPKINEKSHYLKLDKPFRERLKTYSNKSRENMIRIRKLYEREKENEESFHPKLNTEKNKKLLKKKKIESNSNNLNDISNNSKIKSRCKNLYIINHKQLKRINNKSYSNNNILIPIEKNKNDKNKIGYHTKLFLQNEKYRKRKNILTEKNNKSQNKSCCNNSEEIINKKREKYYKILFHLLDSDEDNKITSEHINIFSIPKKIQKILEPIFISLDEQKESLNEIEFVYVCKRLYNTLSYIDKKELLLYIEKEDNYHKKEKKIKYLFKPKINKRNNSYEKLHVTFTNGHNSKSTGIDEKISKVNFNNNIKNSDEIKNKKNNFYFINSGGNERNKKTKNPNFLSNINLNKKIYISKIRIKNKSSLVNKII